MSIVTPNSAEATCAVLNSLLEACVDAERCFHAAISDVESVELREVFMNLSQQHADSAVVLGSEIKRLGGTPAAHGSFTGALKRGWMNLKSEFDDFDEARVLADCERCEARTLEVYHQAIDRGLPPETERIVMQQSAQIQDAYGTIRALAVGPRA